MGGEILGAGDEDRFSMVVEAQADPKSGYLDRVQVIKGWLDDEGATQERVYDVAWAGDDRLQSDGTPSPIGNSVDLAVGFYNGTAFSFVETVKS